MRRNLLLLFVITFALTMRAQVKGNQPQNKNYQQAIVDSMSKAMLSRNIAPLDNVEKELKAKKPNRVYNYWLSFCLLHKALYLTTMKQDQQAQACLNEGEHIFETQVGKNAEEYALLAYIQGVSIKFVKGMDAAVIARKSVNNAQQATQIDPKNTRAWYVLGMLDYYTPKQFGGQQKCEALLEKALAQPTSKTNNPYEPTWGRKEVYNLLLEYLVTTGNKEKAKTIYQKAKTEFPNAPELKKYENQL